MQIVNISQEKLNVYIISDVHIGSKNHNRTAFQKAIKIIQNDKNAK